MRTKPYNNRGYLRYIKGLSDLVTPFLKHFQTVFTYISPLYIRNYAMHRRDMMKKKPQQAYVCHKPMTAPQVLEKAAEIIEERYSRRGEFCSAQVTKEYIQYKLGGYEQEVFAILLLDSQHQLIEFKEMFFGTVDAASVYPREVVKAALKANAAAMILAHNHPSGNPQPSQSDKSITKTLIQALSLIDVRVIDHIVVGKTALSFAELGLL